MGVETLGLAAFLHNVIFFGSCRAFGSPRPVAGVLLVPSASLVIPGNSSMQGERAVLGRNALENTGQSQTSMYSLPILRYPSHYKCCTQECVTDPYAAEPRLNSASVTANDGVPVARLEVLTRNLVNSGGTSLEDECGAVGNPVPVLQGLGSRVLRDKIAWSVRVAWIYRLEKI